MNINRVVLTGNLTRDPELRSTGGGLSVCKLGIAVNTRRKNGSTGDWEEKPNFFRVTVFGRQAESCHQYLKKGRPVAIDGRLEWSSYEQEGQKRESIDIIADSVQFLGSREDAGSGNGFSSSVRATESDVPIDTADFEPAPVGGGTSDEDIPF
ncbi:MAG: single-stranded DNA-binding protein [Solirubrobacterales bacterium]|nr:single-stranded DNA-binding protein [Solirubrobacterales bacterium]MBV9472597.1 single-stranded DNA-binding protein [Solirubrobacterales bacterium]MBV9604480.1 single-stranded DNA-binding protein [Solirubrobacterales bacterium]MBV9839188.1 single-stranded DNA-binding protein [Solirubrobacterales bacterium]